MSLEHDTDQHEVLNPPLPDEEPPESPDPADDTNPQLTKAVEPEVHGIAGETNQIKDAWDAIYDPQSSKFYFHNRETNVTTWDNPRAHNTPVEASTSSATTDTRPDDYAKHFSGTTSEAAFSFQARFDRRTGRFVSDPNRDVKNYSEHARSDRQMSRFFDDKLLGDSGASERAARRAVKHSKADIMAFKQKHKEKREHKRRDWLSSANE